MQTSKEYRKVNNVIPVAEIYSAIYKHCPYFHSILEIQLWGGYEYDEFTVNVLLLNENPPIHEEKNFLVVFEDGKTPRVLEMKRKHRKQIASEAILSN